MNSQEKIEVRKNKMTSTNLIDNNISMKVERYIPLDKFKVEHGKPYNLFSMNNINKYNIKDKDKFGQVINNARLNGYFISGLVPYTLDKTILSFDFDNVEGSIDEILMTIEGFIDNTFIDPDKKRYLTKNMNKNNYHLYYPRIIVDLSTRKNIHKLLDIKSLDDNLLRKGSQIRLDGFRCDVRGIIKDVYMPIGFEYDENFYSETFPDRTGYELDEHTIKLIPIKNKPKKNPYFVVSGENMDYTKIYTDYNNVEMARMFCENRETRIYKSKKQYYSFEIEDCLYKECDKSRVHTEISHFHTPLVNESIEEIDIRINHYKNDDEKSGLLKSLKAIKKNLEKTRIKLSSWAGLSGIANLSDNLIHNEKFGDDLDFINPESFPIKGKKKINLRTLEITDRTPDDLFSYEIDATYNKKNLKNNVMEEFIRSIFDTKEEYEFIRLWLGYHLSPETNEQIFSMLTNDKGGNGKSLLIRIIKHIFTDNIITNADSNLIKKGGDKRINLGAEFFKTEKKRMVIFSDIDECELNNETVKKMVGQDGISARDCHQAGRGLKDIQFIGKIICPLNILPSLNKIEQPLLRRMLIIPFKYIFRNKGEMGYDPKNPLCKPRDNNLYENLITKNDEVFGWCMECVKDYYIMKDNGIKLIDVAPQSYRQFKNDYVEDQDTLSGFIDDCCEVGRLFNVSKKEFYDNYTSYLRDINGNTDGAISVRKMGIELASRLSRFDSKKNSGTINNKKSWIGIRIKKKEEECKIDDSDE